MNIYWFCHEDGQDWKVIAAKDEQEAWEIFSQTDTDNKTVEKLKEEYELDKVTAIGEKSGLIATIFPRDGTILFEEEPETDKSD